MPAALRPQSEAFNGLFGAFLVTGARWPVSRAGRSCQANQRLRPCQPALSPRSDTPPFELARSRPSQPQNIPLPCSPHAPTGCRARLFLPPFAKLRPRTNPFPPSGTNALAPTPGRAPTDRLEQAAFRKFGILGQRDCCAVRRQVPCTPAENRGQIFPAPPTRAPRVLGALHFLL